MDQAVVQFQKAAARENRDRGSVRRRYSSTLQQQAVEYCRERSDRATDGVMSPRRSVWRCGASIAGRVRLRSARGFTRCRSPGQRCGLPARRPQESLWVALAPWNRGRRRLLHALRNRPPGRRRSACISSACRLRGNRPTWDGNVPWRPARVNPDRVNSPAAPSGAISTAHGSARQITSYGSSEEVCDEVSGPPCTKRGCRSASDDRLCFTESRRAGSRHRAGPYPSENSHAPRGNTRDALDHTRFRICSNDHSVRKADLLCASGGLEPVL